MAAKENAIPAYEGNEKYLFISYSHKDRSKVMKYLEKLKELNYRFWYDSGLEPGEQFAKKINEKIKGCTELVVFLSDNVFQSTYCKFELLTAYVNGITICPWVIQDKSKPLSIEPEFQPILSSTHQISLSELDVGVNEYLDRLPPETKDAIALDESGTILLNGEQFSDHACMPDSVAKIGVQAYKNRTTLVSVDFNRVEEIQEEAFRGCTALSEVDMPGCVRVVGDSAFRDCTSLERLIIREDINGKSIEIGERAFENCTSLSAISLPNDLKEIYGGCFNSCKALVSIVLPGQITSIGENAFGGCIGLTSIDIPDSITKIDDLAFSGCIGLTEINLKDGLSKIGKNTFKDCTALRQITLPGTVTKMGTSPFRGCSGLQEIKAEKSRYFKDQGGVLFNKNKSQLICYPAARLTGDAQGRYIIPDSVTEICEWAFADCSTISEIEIPDSVIEIGEGAFFKCKKLEELVIPDSVDRIDDIAFRGCSMLSRIVIPGSVKDLGWGLFSGCNSDLVVYCNPNTTIYDYCSEKQITTAPIDEFWKARKGSKK